MIKYIVISMVVLGLSGCNSDNYTLVWITHQPVSRVFMQLPNLNLDACLYAATRTNRTPGDDVYCFDHNTGKVWVQ